MYVYFNPKSSLYRIEVSAISSFTLSAVKCLTALQCLQVLFVTEKKITIEKLLVNAKTFLETSQE